MSVSSEQDTRYRQGTSNTTSVYDLDNEYGQSVYSNPSLTGPNLGLGNGNGLDISGYTSLPGAVNTDWSELQWGTQSYFTSGSMQTNHTDSYFGKALGYWSTQSGLGTSSFGIYDNPGGYVYQMSTTSGNLNDVLIQSKTVSPGEYTFDHPIVFTANEDISNIRGTDSVYQLGNCFIVSYNHDGLRADFFLQVQIYDSRSGGIQPYSTIGTGAQQVAGVSSLTGGIYNVTSGLYQSPASQVTGYFVDGAVQQVYGNMDGLHTVKIDVNQALLKLVQEVHSGNPALGDAVLNLSNWSLTASYIGTESGDKTASADFYVQNPEVHYDTSKTYSISDYGKPISTIQNQSGQAISTTMSVTATSSGDNYSLGSFNQNIVSNGAWDNLALNGKQSIVYVTNGLAVNGGNGVLTLSGTGASYIAGSYQGLYATLNAQSNVNALLTGTAALHANSGTTNLVGNNAGLTFDGSGNGAIVGTYSSLILNGVQSGQTVAANVSGYAYVQNTQGNVGITSSGTMTLNNNGGVSYTTANGTVNFVGNGGSSTLTGNSLNSANLFYNGGSGSTFVNGSWSSVTGAFGNNVSGNLAVQNSASLYNQGSHLDVTGEFADLTYNSNGTGSSEIVGDWYSATATFGKGDVFNANLQAGFITVQNDANVNISQNRGNQNIDVSINGGNTSLTYGNGNFNIVVNASSFSSLVLNNYEQGHGSIIIDGAQNAVASYNTATNMTSIVAGSSSILLSGNHMVSTSNNAGNLFVGINN